jgi:hypothetical protein
MSSDANPITLSVTSLGQGSQAPTAAKVQVSGGTSLPAGGQFPSQTAAAVGTSNTTHKDLGASDAAAAATSASSKPKPAAAQAQATSASVPVKSADVQAFVAQLNKHLNTTGRPDLYRVDPQSESNIQEVNPANGEVVAQFAASEFPTLARSVGASGLLIDSLA